MTPDAARMYAEMLQKIAKGPAGVNYGEACTSLADYLLAQADVMQTPVGHQAKTIRVRIAVCVSEDGDYSANGWRNKGKDAGCDAANMALMWMEAKEGDKQIRWVEADVPAYEVNEPSVKGTAVVIDK